MMYHTDIATAFRLALTGALDGRTVNFADESTVGVFEADALIGAEFPQSSELLASPWHTDVSLARGRRRLERVSAPVWGFRARAPERESPKRARAHNAQRAAARSPQFPDG